MLKLTSRKLKACGSLLIAVACLLASASAAEKKDATGPLTSITLQREAKAKSPGWTKNFECGNGSAEVERIYLNPRDTVLIRFKFQKSNGKNPASLSAEDGGVINGKSGKVTVSSIGTPSVEFAVGEHRGRYTLRVEQGTSLQILEFWVGQEPPTGTAGPKLSFKGK